MQEIVEMVLQVAKFDSIVLITGESGVGKEIIAHQIYVTATARIRITSVSTVRPFPSLSWNRAVWL